jgi:hypothetical protein
MNTYFILVLKIAFIISSVSNFSQAKTRLPELAKNISGKKWCLEDSITFYLENDPNKNVPFTEAFEFKFDGKLTYTIINKTTKEVNQTLTGTWLASNHQITFIGQWKH